MIRITLNEWVSHLREAIDGAKAANVPADQLAEIAELEAKLIALYPWKIGEATIAVRSAGPPLELSLQLPTTLKEGEEARLSGTLRERMQQSMSTQDLLVAVRQEILSVRPGITSPASVIYRDEEQPGGPLRRLSGLCLH